MRTTRLWGVPAVALAVGVAAHQAPVLVNVHAAAVAVIAVGIALTSVDPGRVLGVSSYLVVCEVYWRLPGSRVPWFGGTYLALAVLAVGWFRLVRGRFDRLALGYVLCLLPAATATVITRDLGEARNALAFNLVGGVVLGVVTAFASRLRGDATDLRDLCWWVIAASMHIGGAALASLTGPDVYSASTESNLSASGGFGPNQVSLALSAGIVAALLLVLDRQGVERVAAMASAGSLSVIAVLTLSRTGAFLSVMALLLTLIARSRTPAQAISLVVRGAVVLIVLVVVVGPRLDEFTGGAASSRFGETTSSHRDEIAAADVEVFIRNPLLGVGVGQSPVERERLGLRGSAAHTEQTRLLAEHGVFGIVALVLMVVLSVRAFRKQPTRLGRGWTAAWVTWSFAGMLVAANRVSMTPFAFGLAALVVGPGVSPAASDDPTSEATPASPSQRVVAAELAP